MRWLKMAAAAAAFVAMTGAANAQPYMGWSSWSLQATKYPGYGGGDNWMKWLTAEHVKAQADVLHAKLQSHGYQYVNMDSGWRADAFDEHGLPMAEPTRFPKGIADMADYVHHRGLKLGIYYNPGIPDNLYNANPTIEGTTTHIQDIVERPTHHATGWNSNYRIDFSRPGAQQYIDSLARRFASWGVDFLKLDGVTPGSDRQGDDGLETDGRAEVAAWHQAIRHCGRPIWLELSWDLNGHYMDDWAANADGWRVYTDVETYNETLTAWYAIRRRFERTRNPTRLFEGEYGWCDLDSVDVACGKMDGLTLDERQSVVTLWAISHAPLYTGDDLTQMDDDGLRLLTNDEVIAADHAGPLPTIRIDRGDIRIWYSVGGDGEWYVAVFNLNDSTKAPVSLKWSDLGMAAPTKVRDLWAHSDLESTPDGITLPDIPAHGSRLLAITPISKPLLIPSMAVSPATICRVVLADNDELQLGVRDNSRNDAAPLTVTHDVPISTWWQVYASGDGTYALVNTLSEELVNIPGPTDQAGAGLCQYFDDGKPNSRWKIEDAGDGTVRFVSASDGLVMAATDAGTVVQEPKSDTSRHQRWRLVPSHPQPPPLSFLLVDALGMREGA